ncbi:MAG: hypothetical protein ACJAY1_001597, partial [Glaciecola sp.]
LLRFRSRDCAFTIGAIAVNKRSREQHLSEFKNPVKQNI